MGDLVSIAENIGATQPNVPDFVLEEVERVEKVAVHTGSRAYSFMKFGDNSKLEVRVWPDGRWVVTPVTDSGRPLPLKEEPKGVDLVEPEPPVKQPPAGEVRKLFGVHRRK